jgi:hypothetical protein
MPTFDISNRTPEALSQEISSGVHGDLLAVTRLAMEFKACADRAEKDFIVFLRAIELSGVWQQTDCGTFTKFLERNYIATNERYEAGVKALTLIAAPVISAISFASAREVAKISDPVRREAGVQRMTRWADDNGRPPSAQTTRKLLGLQNVTQPTPKASRIEVLETENAQLRAEVDRLRGLVLRLGGDPDGAQAAE